MPSEAAEWKYWDEKATEIRRTQLATVQSSATKWSGLIAALLGVFGTAGFAGGLSTIDKLADPWALVAKTMTSAAALFGLLGIWFLSKAAGGLQLTKLRSIHGASVRDLYTTNTKDSLNNLKWGKRWGVVGASLVLAGSGLVLWVGEKAETTPPSSVAVVADGQLLCGPLGTTDGQVFTVAGRQVEDVTALVSVAKCPEKVAE